MAVTAATVSATRTDLARKDPRLPIGFWYVTQTALSDGTGGLLTMNFNVDIPTGGAWSLEEMCSSTNAAVTIRNVVWRATRNPPGIVSQLMIRNLVENDTSFAAVDNVAWGDGMRSILTDSHADAVIVLEFLRVNEGAATFTVQAWGYLWDVEAFQLPGGPVRPSASGLALAAPGAGGGP